MIRLGLSALILLTCQASAETLIITSAKDNTLFSESGNKSNGSGIHLFAGRTSSTALRRALMQFDLSAIPENATIDQVTLTIFMSKTRVGGNSVALHRVLQNWGEGTSDATGEEGGGATAASGDATWTNTFTGSGTWDTDGGDFNSIASAATVVNNSSDYTWGSTPELVADVQSWLNDPASNFGWILIGPEAGGQSAKRFDSREHSEAERWPRLNVSFTLPSANQAPQVNDPIPAQTTTVDALPFSRDLNGEPSVFTDPDGDPLSFSATSSDESIVQVSISNDVFTATPLAPGLAEITLTANDGNEGSASFSFTITVAPPNQPPVISTAINDQTLETDDPAFSRDLNAEPSVFTDPDGDALSYTANAADTAVASVSLAGSILTISPLAPGQTQINLSANDQRGGSISISFNLTVEAPVQILIADFDNNDTVDIADFFLFSEHFDTNTESPQWDERFDLDASGDIDFPDFFIFAELFGSTIASE